ncbi:hypothetical protein CLV94_0360 [Flavobacterium endophyticum]|uniref:Uncharacterized protein n=1 Tax=Flavobacterium endophyticum TaxID=1540163 RepID=A0A495MIW2_9FLAO|nr:hypothetical protein CLV94_0360 [Flavobacterium endophyticum]
MLQKKLDICKEINGFLIWLGLVRKKMPVLLGALAFLFDAVFFIRNSRNRATHFFWLRIVA